MLGIRLRTTLAAFTAAAILGCASAGKRLEQGTEHEARGEYTRAAERYIEALKKDRDLTEARERLVDVAPRAVAEYLDGAGAFRASGDSIGAADQFIGLDALAAEAGAVGVAFPLPTDYVGARRRAFDGAIVQLLDQARVSIATERWSTARRAADRIDRYAPSSGQADRQYRVRLETALGWAESDMAAGRFRTALVHADEAVELADGAGGGLADRALALRHEVVDLGTLPLATTPLWRTDEGARFMPEEFLGALNDALDLDWWSSPPLLIAVADPALVRQELRAQRLTRALLTPSEAARMGRSVGAELVVVGAVNDFTVTERRVTERVQKARLRGGADTSFVYRSGTLDYKVRINYAIVDVEARREVDRGTVEAGESGSFEMARFSGDWRRLELTRNEARWFELAESREHEWTIEERLVAEAGGRLANRVYGDALQQVDCRPPCRR